MRALDPPGCVVFEGSPVYCPGCAFSYCVCAGGSCPSYTIICNYYIAPISHTDGVSIAEDTTHCYWQIVCEAPPTPPCIPFSQYDDCEEIGTALKLGTFTFLYAWEACPL